MPDAWQQLITEWPILAVIADACKIILPLSCLAAYCGLFFLSAIAAIIAKSRKRAAFRKCARQLAFLGFILGWILLVCGRVWLYYYNPAREPDAFESYILEISWLLLSIGVMLGTIYLFLWNALKNMPVLHVTLGMIAAVQNCLSLAFIIFTMRISAAFTSAETNEIALPNIFPNAWDAPLWSAAIYTVPLIFSMAAAFGLCWLAMRRKKDDFGRDYYSAMLPWCASWAKNSWAVLLLLVFCSSALKIWTEMNGGEINLENIIYECSTLLLWIIPFLLWLIVQKSRMPLRNRWLCYIALPIAITFILPWFMDITQI